MAAKKKGARSKRSSSHVTKKATRKTRTRSSATASTKQSTAKKATRKRAARKVTKKNTKELKKQKVSGGTGRIAITDATNTQQKKRSKKRTPTQTKKRTISSASRVQLALLSPLRFPVAYDQLLAQTARVGGLTFVTLGALLLILNLHALNSDPRVNVAKTQAAATLDSTMDSTMEDTEPPVDFLTQASEPLEGTVRIEYVVSGAERIDIGAFYKDREQYVAFGAPEQTSADTWEYHWDTTQFPDGEYRLLASVTNVHGTYEDRDSSYLQVDNIVDTTTETTSTTDATTDSTTETTEEATIDPTASITVVTDDRSHEEVTLAVEVANAEDVLLIAYNKETGERKKLGSAYYDGSDTWKYLWDTTSFESGTYVLSATIENAHDVYDSGHTEFELTRDPQETTDSTDTVSEEETTEEDKTIRIDETEDPVSILMPPIDLRIPDPQDMRGTEEIRVFVDEAAFVEIYAVPNYGITPHFLGLAQQHDTDEWRFRMDTTQTPNGEYEIFARVKNSYGLYDSDPVFVSIENDRTDEHTLKEKLYIEEIKSVDATTTRTTSTTTQMEDTIATEREALLTSDAISASSTRTDLTEDLQRFEETIRKRMAEYAVALRNDDTEKIERIEEDIQDLRDELLEELGTRALSQALLERIDTHLETIADELKRRTERNEEIIRERVGDKVFDDTDGDGIADYDEVNLYNTDPFSADSDNDGFIDGAEIARGFNPTDSTTETLVEYESPKETGVVRDDLLKVNSISSFTPDIDDSVADGVEPVAIISGKALPNSYVTIYIFSTPIVVTVKTDDDGSWSYTFDKELPDGEHEIYAGVTDNAGRIVAKSEPFGFVKTAEAFTPTDAAAAAPSTGETDSAAPSVISQNMVFAVASGGVVVIGLVLLLLGMHVHARKPNVPAHELA